MKLDDKFLDLYDGTITDALKSSLKQDICNLLQKIVHIEDDVIPDYICLMVVNGKKTMNDIKNDLVEFFGDDMALEFTLTLIQSLEKHLPTIDTSSNGKLPIEKPKQTVVSLKSVKSSAPTTNGENKPKESSGGRIISLKGLKGNAMDEKRLDERRKRWGMSTPQEKPIQQSRSKSKEKDRSNIASKLGPPVSIEQAEMDVRSTIGSSNKRKHKGKEDDEPPTEPKQKQHQPNPPSQYYPPPGMYPPHYPYQPRPGMEYMGHPPYQSYGPYHGYPPRSMRPPRGRGHPRGHYNGNNWNNNNHGGMTEGNSEDKDPNSSVEQPTQMPSQHMPPQHSPYQYTPRPYSYYGRGYNGGYAPRPRAKFGNKTWVRSDPAKTETAPSAEQEQKLSESLPKTPPAT